MLNDIWESIRWPTKKWGRWYSRMGSTNHNTIKVYTAIVFYTVLLLMVLVWAVIYHVLAPAITFIGGLVATTRLWQSLRSRVRNLWGRLWP